MRRVRIIAILAAMVVVLMCAQCRRAEPPSAAVEADAPGPIQRVDTAELEKWLGDSNRKRNQWLRVERIEKNAKVDGSLAGSSKVTGSRRATLNNSSWTCQPSPSTGLAAPSCESTAHHPS